MLHHVSVGVGDVARAARFYDSVLGALGYKRVMEYLPYAIAYGETVPEFWIGLPHDQRPAGLGNGTHVAFNAKSRDAVNAFHAAALAAGGTDEGAPGPREDYSPDYYGAFARDPDGNKIEAVLVAAAPKAKPKSKVKAKAKAKPKTKSKAVRKPAVTRKSAVSRKKPGQRGGARRSTRTRKR